MHRYSLLQWKCFKSQYYQDLCKTAIKKQKKKSLRNIKMLDLSLKELRAIATIRGIKDYKSVSKDKLLSMLDKSEQVKKLRLLEIQEKKILIAIKY